MWQRFFFFIVEKYILSRHVLHHQTILDVVLEIQKGVTELSAGYGCENSHLILRS